MSLRTALTCRSAAVAAAGAVLLLVALAFDTGPLFVPGLAFLLLGVLLPPIVRIAALGAGVRRLEGAREVVEGARYRSTVVVTAGPLGLLGAELMDPIDGAPKPVPVRLGPTWPRPRAGRFEVLTSFPRRGLTAVGSPVLAVHDPLGFERVERRDPAHHEVLVLPAVSAVRWTEPGGRGRARAEAERAQADALAAVEIDGLRPYRPGTPAARIHWPALARGAGLLERRLRAEEDPRPVVVLDTRCAHGDATELDAPVRAAASLVLALARLGGCGLLVGDDARLLEVDSRLTGWRTAHRRLALAAPAARAPRLSGARLAGAVHYVMADATAQPPQALREHGGVLVRPRRSGAPRPPRTAVVLEVGGCVGIALRPHRGRHAAVSTQAGGP